MKKTRIGILSPSNIAFNRFLPSLMKLDEFEYVGIALANQEEWFKSSGTLSDDLRKVDQEKAQKFVDNYGGAIFDSYFDLLNDTSIDAVYIPLPPQLHFEWVKKAFVAGKHVLVEKPSTTNYNDTVLLTQIAEEKQLAFHENYMFQYHNQLHVIEQMIQSGELGEIRGYKMTFGFPLRHENDFRYNKSLGGGALLDCGGYPIKLASILLGETAQIVHSKLNCTKAFEVDMFGSVVMENNDGIVAQILFGMDNAYQCQLEVWGSKMTLIAPRIFTAGADIHPTLTLKSSSDECVKQIDCDDQFLNSIQHFKKCIEQQEVRTKNYKAIRKQSELVERVKV
ncbi:MAG: Gfo/Idh/MocA family protein [Velocimicrobium sp.]